MSDSSAVDCLRIEATTEEVAAGRDMLGVRTQGYMSIGTLYSLSLGMGIGPRCRVREHGGDWDDRSA